MFIFALVSPEALCDFFARIDTQLVMITIALHGQVGGLSVDSDKEIC